MAKKGAFDVALVAYNFSMDRTMDQAIETAAKSGIGIVAMKVMAGGFRRLRAGDPLRDKLSRDGAMLSALKWTIKNPNIATTIPSMTDMDQLEENLKAMSAPYSSGDQKLLASHHEFIRPLYCNMCGECDGTCTKGLPVAEVLRSLMYAEGYGQFALGREHFLQLGHAVSRCADCTECTVQCPLGVHVAARVQHAQELFA
jgi:predicted aldo/keto reductase-like oxidoreductase